MRVDTLAFRKSKNATTKKLASEVGFCIDDRLADAIAESVVHKIAGNAAECEARMNHLYRGRNSFTLSERDKRELAKLAGQFEYLAKTAREVLEAQEASETVTLQAAE
jgi:hypothetical protein